MASKRAGARGRYPDWPPMPKMKSHSGAKKRFKKTATGKLKSRPAFSSHILEKKSPKKKRALGLEKTVAKADRKTVQQAARRQRAMTRVKRSVHARKKRRATLERAKGYRGEAHSSYRRAKEALMKADSYAYRDRRNRKRDFRRLWITRINAAARQNGHDLRHLHARPQAGRDRDRPQGPRRHRRARCRHVPPICRRRPRGVAGLTADDT